MSRVIFLDIDGVLCTSRSHMAFNGGKGSGYMQHLDPVGVKLIESLQNETKAEIVMSSTWTEFHDSDSMRAILMNAGMANPDFHSCWKTNKKLQGRGQQIQQWMDFHGKPERYVIIDDDDDLLDHQLPFWVQTTMDDGLSYRGYKNALRILLGLPL